MRKNGKKYLLVSIDQFSGWPVEKFRRRPTTTKVLELLKQYITQNGVPKKIRTDSGTIFNGEVFTGFCKQFEIEHITCPVRDHRRSGQTERLIRTINERPRANKQTILSNDKSELSEVLY